MALSKDWTVARFIQHALLELGLDLNNVGYVQRLEIINQAQSAVASMFYDLMANAYLTPITILPDTTGRYANSGTGTFTTATGNLLFVDMNTDFGSGDVGKTIIFRVGALVYIGQVSVFVDADNVIVTGHNLPTTNQTVDYVLLAASTPTGNNISVAGLRLMRTAAVQMVLQSTATETVLPMSEDELMNWQTSAPSNKGSVAWSLTGDLINLRKGDDLSTYGTFTLQYPRVPYNVTLDADFIDLPDGVPIDIAMIKVESLIAKRVPGAKLVDRSAELEGMIRSLYASAGREFTLEIVKDKIRALN